MKRPIIIFLSQENFREQEYFDSIAILEGYRYPCEVVTLSRDSAIGEVGTEVEPTLAIGEVEPQRYAGIIVIGGPGVMSIQDEPVVMKLLQGFYQQQKIIGGLSEAPLILANAGLLIGKSATALPELEQQIKDRGAEYTGMPVTVDRFMVTAKDWSNIKKFIDTFLYVME